MNTDTITDLKHQDAEDRYWNNTQRAEERTATEVRDALMLAIKAALIEAGHDTPEGRETFAAIADNVGDLYFPIITNGDAYPQAADLWPCDDCAGTGCQKISGVIFDEPCALCNGEGC